MINDELTVYEQWDLHNQPHVPPRSSLYQLEPMGMGTPFVESLTGYVQRLAQAHCVVTGMLISTEIAPLFKVGYTCDNRVGGLNPIYGSVRSTKALNGTGLMASTQVMALEALTLRNDLRGLTMLTWASVLPSKGLLRSVRAWCPTCYQEWRAAGQVIYEPLIWALDVVRICPRHHRHLLFLCPHCQQQLPLLSWRSVPGYCSKCHRCLGVSTEATISSPQVLSEFELKWQLWAVNNIGELVATALALPTLPSKATITKNIFTCVNQLTQGNITAFARLLGMSPSLVREWYVGKSLPQFRSIVAICYHLEISSLLDFLSVEVAAINSSLTTRLLTKLPNQLRTPSHEFDLEQAQAMLLAALNEPEPPPVAEVARRLGQKGGWLLYKYFPSLCRAISSQHADYKKAKSIAEIQQGLEAALERDFCPPPSLQEVARRIKYSQTTLYKYFPSLCRAISAKYLSYCKAARMQREEQLRAEIWLTALELYAQGVIPNSCTVSKHLPKPGLMRDKVAQTTLGEVRRFLNLET